MKLLGIKQIADFKAKHAKARKVLDRWTQLIEGCLAKHFVELKQTFPAADQVKGYTVFDVGGNNYRVITVVDYKGQTTMVSQVFTHNEYDAWKA